MGHERSAKVSDKKRFIVGWWEDDGSRNKGTSEELTEDEARAIQAAHRASGKQRHAIVAEVPDEDEGKRKGR